MVQKHHPNDRVCVCGAVIRVATALFCACGAALPPIHTLHQVGNHAAASVSGWSAAAPADLDRGAKRLFGPTTLGTSQVAGGTAITGTGSLALPRMRMAGAGSVSSLS